MCRRFVIALVLIASALPAAPASANTDPVIVSGYLLSGWGGGMRPPGDTYHIGNVALYLNVDSEERVELPIVAHGTTDGVGYFELRTANTPELAAAAAAEGGQLNLELFADMNGYIYFDSVTRTFVDGVWLDEDLTPDQLFVEADNGRTCPNGKCPMPMGAEGEPPGPAGQVTSQASPQQCIRYKFPIASRVAQATIGELHNANDVVSSVFEYGQRADSHIEKGFSLNGSVWKIKGSAHVRNSNGDSKEHAVRLIRTEDNWAHVIRSDFRFTKFRHELACPFRVVTGFSIEATRWVPSIYVGADVSSLDGHCLEKPREWQGRFAADSGYSRNRSRYHQFELGATLGAEFVGNGGGLSFGTRSGLSTWVNVSWRFGDQIPLHYLCGSNGPLDTARRIFAGA